MLADTPQLRTYINVYDSKPSTIEALVDGTACMVASDHAPHSYEEKNNPEYNKNLNGIIGLETMIPIIYTHFVTLHCRRFFVVFFATI